MKSLHDDSAAKEAVAKEVSSRGSQHAWPSRANGEGPEAGFPQEDGQPNGCPTADAFNPACTLSTLLFCFLKPNVYLTGADEQYFGDRVFDHGKIYIAMQMILHMEIVIHYDGRVSPCERVPKPRVFVPTKRIK